jgi:hypothetical protein
MKIAELLIGFSAGMSIAIIITDAIHKSVYSDTIDPYAYKILIGPKDMPQCSQEIPLSIWDSMNELQIWRWVVECVEKYEK